MSLKPTNEENAFSEGYEEGLKAGRAAGLEEAAVICDELEKQNQSDDPEEQYGWDCDDCAYSIRRASDAMKEG